MSKPSKAVEWLTEDGLQHIRWLARDGKSDGDIAKIIGISHAGFSKWKKQYGEISSALASGRKVCHKVEDSLETLTQERRVTIKKPVVLRTVKQDGSKKIIEEHVEYVDVEQYFPPNVNAVKFYLAAHKPEMYNVKPVDNSGEEEKANGKLAEIIEAVKNV